MPDNAAILDQAASVREPHLGPAFHAICSTPWAIQAEWLRTILAIAARESAGAEAVAAQLGRPLDNSHAVTVRSGVATIPIVGPIFRYADFFSAISGGVEIDTLATDLQTALVSPQVTAIVLMVDSPGGEVNGVAEFAQHVFAARAVKPIIAYISNLGASAGYWISSAASEIVVASTAMVGSIGIVMAMPDPTQRSAREIQFVSSQSPKKVPDPTTESGATQLQDLVDTLAQEFIADVARYRGVTAAQVLADFGQGDILVGKMAVAAGLADRVGSYEGVLAELAPDDGQQQPTLLRAPQRRPAASSGELHNGLRLAAGPLASLSTPLALRGLVPLLGEPPTPPMEEETMASQTHEATDDDEMVTGTIQPAVALLPEHRETLESVGVTAEMDTAPALRLVCAALTTARADVGRLTPLADQGRAYHADLLAETLAEGVRAMGDAFPAETYQALLATASLDQLKALKADWATRGDARLPGGRVTADQESDGRVPAPPAIPDAAFAG